MGGVLGILKLVGWGLIKALLTEAVLKRLAVLFLEEVVSRTENKIDDRVLLEAKKAWGIK